MRSIAIPAISNEDRLPHHAAVWRAPPQPLDCPDGDPSRQISVDYGKGLIEQTTVGKAVWSLVIQWRYGWAPRS